LEMCGWYWRGNSSSGVGEQRVGGRGGGIGSLFIRSHSRPRADVYMRGGLNCRREVRKGNSCQRGRAVFEGRVRAGKVGWVFKESGFTIRGYGEGSTWVSSAELGGQGGEVFC